MWNTIFLKYRIVIRARIRLEIRVIARDRIRVKIRVKARDRIRDRIRAKISDKDLVNIKIRANTKIKIRVQTTIKIRVQDSGFGVCLEIILRCLRYDGERDTCVDCTGGRYRWTRSQRTFMDE